MLLLKLRIRNFRNIQTADLAFEKGINIFIGDNAQGKTSLLESVIFLATATSHRANKDEMLIRIGESAANVRGEIQKQGISTNLEFGVSPKNKYFKIDSLELKKIADLFGSLLIVPFFPEDLVIVDGSPQERRRFIDISIAQSIGPEYVILLQNYKRCLKQRNELLRGIRDGFCPPDLLDPWDTQLIQLGAKIQRNRIAYLEKLNPILLESQKQLSTQLESTRISYSPILQFRELKEFENNLSENLAQSVEVDISRGFTSVGPHRDDLIFKLNDMDIRQYGSQGQRRSFVLSLRLAESNLLRQLTGYAPLLLVDDVLHEMDPRRRCNFLRLLDSESQCFITSTCTDDIKELLPQARTFSVDNGVFR